MPRHALAPGSLLRPPLHSNVHMNAFIIVFRWRHVVETEALGFDMLLPHESSCLPAASLLPPS